MTRGISEAEWQAHNQRRGLLTSWRVALASQIEQALMRYRNAEGELDVPAMANWIAERLQNQLDEAVVDGAGALSDEAVTRIASKMSEELPRRNKPVPR